MTLKAAILGGTGYGGMELLRLLVSHPDVEVAAVTNRRHHGPVSAVHPHLAGFVDLEFEPDDEVTLARLAREVDVMFQAKPHGISRTQTPALLAASPDVRVIDLSRDFRASDDAGYGLPECGGREAIRGRRLVANPGCHASSAILALWPFVRAGVVAGPVAVTSVTGSSGSGVKPQRGTHHPERFSNFKAYKPLRHPHLAEILNALGGGVKVGLVPCSGPFARGIHTTAIFPVGDLGEAEARTLLRDAYDEEVFLRIQDAPPELRTVVGTNFAGLSVTVEDGLACVNAALDNLGKGMAGTAVQNLNLLFDLPETRGLDRPACGL